MKSRWGSNQSGSAGRTPVEMRFVDMFMTALGSMIFVSLLLVYVIANFPAGGLQPVQDASPDAGELKLYTTVLPDGQVGEAYNIAVAYRGGAGQVRWSVEGGSDGLPPGVSFDLDDGVIRGQPSTAGLYAFTVTATDQDGKNDARAYEIEVAPAEAQPVAFNIWVAGILAALLLLAALVFFRQALVFFAITKQLSDHYRATSSSTYTGQYRNRQGQIGTIVIPLPSGIDERRQMGQRALTNAILALIGAGVTGVYLLSILNAQ